jgi:hypothetical protein
LDTFESINLKSEAGKRPLLRVTKWVGFELWRGTTETTASCQPRENAEAKKAVRILFPVPGNRKRGSLQVYFALFAVFLVQSAY